MRNPHFHKHFPCGQNSGPVDLLVPAKTKEELRWVIFVIEWNKNDISWAFQTVEAHLDVNVDGIIHVFLFRHFKVRFFANRFSEKIKAYLD